MVQGRPPKCLRLHAIYQHSVCAEQVDNAYSAEGKTNLVNCVVQTYFKLLKLFRFDEIAAKAFSNRV